MKKSKKKVKKKNVKQEFDKIIKDAQNTILSLYESKIS